MMLLKNNDKEITSMVESLVKVSSQLKSLYEDYAPILNEERYITDKQLSKLLHVCNRIGLWFLERFFQFLRKEYKCNK